MRALLDDEYAPLTNCIAFGHAPLESVVAARLKQHPRWKPTKVDVPHPFPEALRALLPAAKTGHNRELVVACGEWTALFTNAVLDASVTIARNLGDWLEADVVSILAVPTTQSADKKGPGRWGGTAFELWLPVEGGSPRTRHVMVSNQAGRWEFNESGGPLEFEDTERYNARTKRDRLTTDMLDRYCQALGIRPFDASFYQGPCALVDLPGLQVPEMGSTLEDAQAAIAWMPGQAASAKG